MHSARQQDYFRRLDRVLAARYVQECMLRRDRRSRTPQSQTQSDQPQIWQPRCVLTCYISSNYRQLASL